MISAVTRFPQEYKPQACYAQDNEYALACKALFSRRTYPTPTATVWRGASHPGPGNQARFGPTAPGNVGAWGGNR